MPLCVLTNVLLSFHMKSAKVQGLGSFITSHNETTHIIYAATVGLGMLFFPDKSVTTANRFVDLYILVEF